MEDTTIMEEDKTETQHCNASANYNACEGFQVRNEIRHILIGQVRLKELTPQMRKDRVWRERSSWCSQGLSPKGRGKPGNLICTTDSPGQPVLI
jgi:hypothetical protein